MSGELKVVASSDLKGLGANDGPAVAYRWVMPSVMPLLLPWLVVLGLLALKFNRNARAWWIVVPLGLAAGAVWGLGALGEQGPGFNAAVDTCGQLVLPMTYGLAALWLLAPVLARRPWPLVLLGMLVIQTLMSLVAVLASADAESIPETMGMAIGASIFSFGLALALALAGLVCRRRYGAGRLLLWDMVFLFGGWTVVAVPFCLVALLASSFGEFVPWWSFPLAAVVIAGGSVAVVLPFLLLALASSFYGERLKALFVVPGQSAAPPAPPPSVPLPQPV